MAYGVGQFENSPACVQSSDSGYSRDDGDDDVGGPAVMLFDGLRGRAVWK
jgi:hypothetical protein